ncbi:MAG: hypothetical protein ABIV05_02740 [Actinomycetota bacterium]
MTTSTTTRPTEQAAPARNTAYSALIGVTTLLILLQGLWAGIFLQHDGERDAAQSWIDLHARGADLSIVLAAAATAVAFWKLRQRRDLWIGSAVLTVVLVLESYIGGLIVDASKDVLTAVHVPLAMVLVGLAVWLPLRARNRA